MEIWHVKGVVSEFRDISCSDYSVGCVVWPLENYSSQLVRWVLSGSELERRSRFPFGDREKANLCLGHVYFEVEITVL